MRQSESRKRDTVKNTGMRQSDRARGEKETDSKCVCKKYWHETIRQKRERETQRK